MLILNERSFHRLQMEYLFLVIQTAYVHQQEALFAFLRGKQINLPGDGCCNSPGYTVKHCTYSLMDNVDYSLVQIAEMGSSVAMEKRV